jgi:ketosteroid isomerase-like protein
MPAEENIQTVKDMYDAFTRGDAEAILEGLTDDVDWATEAEEGLTPWSGQRTGKDGAGRFFQDVAGAVEVLEFTPQAFTANDDEVMALIRYRAKARATGKEVAMNLHHYWRFRDGKVEYYRGSEDTAQTAAALSG